MKSWLTAGILALAGCGAPDPRPRAEDIVCLCNGDLGCVIVRVDEQTPRAEHEGRVYYFCAESCRKAFLKDPARFAAEARRRGLKDPGSP